jgi:hypothetical protein
MLHDPGSGNAGTARVSTASSGRLRRTAAKSPRGQPGPAMPRARQGPAQCPAGHEDSTLRATAVPPVTMPASTSQDSTASSLPPSAGGPRHRKDVNDRDQRDSLRHRGSRRAAPGPRGTTPTTGKAAGQALFHGGIPCTSRLARHPGRRGDRRAGTACAAAVRRRSSVARAGGGAGLALAAALLDRPGTPWPALPRREPVADRRPVPRGNPRRHNGGGQARPAAPAYPPAPGAAMAFAGPGLKRIPAQPGACPSSPAPASQAGHLQHPIRKEPE